MASKNSDRMGVRQDLLGIIRLAGILDGEWLALIRAKGSKDHEAYILVLIDSITNGPPVLLAVLSGNQTTVGRDMMKNKLSLANSARLPGSVSITVSRSHADIRLAQDDGIISLVVTDTRSVNGTTVHIPRQDFAEADFEIGVDWTLPFKDALGILEVAS